MIVVALIRKGGLRRLVAEGVATVAVALPTVPDADDIHEWWQERAAIMEYDGGLSRAEAEAAAWARVSTRHPLH
jgi:hypothetical protein